MYGEGERTELKCTTLGKAGHISRWKWVGIQERMERKYN